MTTFLHRLLCAQIIFPETWKKQPSSLEGRTAHEATFLLSLNDQEQDVLFPGGLPRAVASWYLPSLWVEADESGFSSFIH